MAKATVTVKCENCGKPFKPKRSTARFCSGVCRVKFSRKPVKELPSIPLSTKTLKTKVILRPKAPKAFQGNKAAQFMADEAGKFDAKAAIAGIELVVPVYSQLSQQNIGLLKRNAELEQANATLLAELRATNDKNIELLAENAKLRQKAGKGLSLADIMKDNSEAPKDGAAGIRALKTKK